jgi:thioredoxin
MRKIVLFTVVIIILTFTNCSAGNSENKVKGTPTNTVVMSLTNDTFKKLVYNYDLNKEWKFEGTKPVIIDFYADWCPPCRQLSPLVEEIAKEYNGKIIVYKVNTDNEKGLAQSLGIASLPTLLYIPVSGKPRVTLGAITRETLVNTINEILLTK